LQNGLAIARYLVYCGTSPSNLSQVGTATTGPSYTYRSALANTKYYCDVVAVDSANDDSTPSAQIVVTTPPMPNAPTNVVAAASGAKVIVTWNENVPQTGLQVLNYTIFRGTSKTNMPQVATRTTASYTDLSVTNGQTYYYAIEATDTGHDVSPMSATAQVVAQ
jgi:fibronectin type 3 domain-containing protein